MSDVWLGPNGEVKRLVPVRRGAERVLRAVYVWCAMEWARRDSVAWDIAYGRGWDNGYEHGLEDWTK